MNRILTRIRRHRHAGAGHSLDPSGIRMILRVKTLEVKKKTFLVNLVQLKAHLHLNRPQTSTKISLSNVSTTQQHCTVSESGGKYSQQFNFSAV